MSYRSGYSRSRYRSGGPSVWALLGLAATLAMPLVILTLVLTGSIR